MYGGLTYPARFVILSRVVPLFFPASSIKGKEMDAPRSCKCGGELSSAELEVRSGIRHTCAFACDDCGATLAVYNVFEAFGISGEPDLEVWLNEWTEGGGAEETLAAFLRQAFKERRRKTTFSAGA